MATIVISVATMAEERTISGADSLRIIAALQRKYGQVDDGRGGLRDRTSQEVFDLWASSTFQQLKEITLRQEQEAAAETAVSVVTEISYS